MFKISPVFRDAAKLFFKDMQTLKNMKIMDVVEVKNKIKTNMSDDNHNGIPDVIEQQMTAGSSTKLIINGAQYSSWDEVPQELQYLKEVLKNKSQKVDAYMPISRTQYPVSSFRDTTHSDQSQINQVPEVNLASSPISFKFIFGMILGMAIMGFALYVYFSL